MAVMLRAGQPWRCCLRGAASARQFGGSATGARVRHKAAHASRAALGSTTRPMGGRQRREGGGGGRAPLVGAAAQLAARQTSAACPRRAPAAQADKPFEDMQDPGKTRPSYSAGGGEAGGRAVPGPEDDGVEREVKWGKNIPASAQQAREELAYVSGSPRGQTRTAPGPTRCSAAERAAFSGHGLHGVSLAAGLRAHPQAGKGLAESVEMGVNVLVSKAKDTAAAAARAVGLNTGRGPEMSHGGMGAAGKMEHAPPGTRGGFDKCGGQGSQAGTAGCAAVCPIRSLADSLAPDCLPPVAQRSGKGLSEELARAKYDEIAAAEKPAFPEGERSINDLVRRRRGARRPLHNAAPGARASQR